MHTVKVVRDRPDFRVFIDLLYGADRNVDTDGDSNPISSRVWTFLYVKDRESDDPCVEIYVSDDDPAVFVVESGSSRLEELAALYLFLTCGESIRTPEKAIDHAAIDALSEQYRAELVRANDSISHQPSPESPYPNLQ
ncbi:hypothetical protein [Dyella sp.]|uniref:hypothetical protein n=1 Tax=Dyella sp. TaxID=1869338 RepID=UPI002847D3CA|nr:hypothetical protein [Dyella sp.]MDR3447602.1 hypothetical protein [Dyella sp.]